MTAARLSAFEPSSCSNGHPMPLADAAVTNTKGTDVNTSAAAQQQDAPAAPEITRELLKEWEACTGGFKWFCSKFPQGASFADVYKALRDDKRFGDANWLVDRVFENLDTLGIIGGLPAALGAVTDQIVQDVATIQAEAPQQDASTLAASGYASKLAASGYASTLAASGDASKLAASGENSLLLGSYNARVQAGNGGAFVIAWWDGKANRPRIAVGYVGEECPGVGIIKAGTWYRVNDSGQIVEADQ